MYQRPNHLASTPMNRWEELKPVIEQLYLREKKKVTEVVLLMKKDYGFDAVEHQYKHHFRKWQWKKNIPNSKKDKIAEHLESRARAGKQGTTITLQGRLVESHKIRRYMKTKARNESQDMVLKKASGIEGVVTGPVLPFANSFFLKWNIPFAAMRRSQTRPFDHTSPLGFSAPTPGSDISVATPTSAPSPGNAPSPTTLLLKEKAAIDRAHLFAQGQHEKLLMSMDGEERRVMSEWLYEYWLFCFKTAKYWGRGPLAWTAALLDFASFQPDLRRSLPGTPRDGMSDPGEDSREGSMPTSLCRWFIHVEDGPSYSEIPEEGGAQDLTDQDPNDESTWLPWPNDLQEPPLPTRLRDALEHNDFSSISSTTLPIAIPQIAKAAQSSADELLLESLGFSIMSRNTTQVVTIMQELEDEGIDITSLYPLHMATSYLDGYKACCDIFTTLLPFIAGPSLRDMFINDLGHTVIDNLMITILKSHSSVTPVTVDDTLKDAPRFIGEEVDICGRWDADSP